MIANCATFEVAFFPEKTQYKHGKNPWRYKTCILLKRNHNRKKGQTQLQYILDTPIMTFYRSYKNNYRVIGAVFDCISVNMNKYQKPIILTGKQQQHLDFSNPSNYLPLPAPRHEKPYRLSFEKESGTNIEESLSFHMVGDTGSFKNFGYQFKIIDELVKNANAKKDVDFLFHLGDVVYHHGEASEYHQQFFKPFEDYPAPIFAIAGNHDGDLNPEAETPYESLDAFMDVFCNNKKDVEIPFAGSSKRKSINQPYVYWTLETSLVNIIGLYGNNGKFGLIDEEQRKWFIQELIHAGTQKEEKLLFIAIHQSPYSADTNHGSSLYMINFLEEAFKEADVYPDMVFSAHVHNYQRYHKLEQNNTITPYIVAGAGGYAILHPLAEKNNPDVRSDVDELKNVSLERYCDHQYGFLKMTVTRTDTGLKVQGQYYSIHETDESDEFKTTLFDDFDYFFNRKTSLQTNLVSQ